MQIAPDSIVLMILLLGFWMNWIKSALYFWVVCQWMMMQRLQQMTMGLRVAMMDLMMTQIEWMKMMMRLAMPCLIGDYYYYLNSSKWKIGQGLI